VLVGVFLAAGVDANGLARQRTMDDASPSVVSRAGAAVTGGLDRDGL